MNDDFRIDVPFETRPPRLKDLINNFVKTLKDLFSFGTSCAKIKIRTGTAINIDQGW